MASFKTHLSVLELHGEHQLIPVIGQSFPVARFGEEGGAKVSMRSTFPRLVTCGSKQRQWALLPPTAVRSDRAAASYLKSWSPPGPAACRRCSSPHFPETSRLSWVLRTQSRAASGSTCLSSAPPPAPPRRRHGSHGSAAPGQWRTPPQRGFCPTSSSAASGRWAQGSLRRASGMDEFISRSVSSWADLQFTYWWKCDVLPINTFLKWQHKNIA